MIEVISGIMAGVCTGLGMGGGAILVAILTGFMKIDQKLAQATNLIFFIPTSIIVIFYNLKNKNIDFKKDIFIIIFGAAGSILGSFISAKINMEILKKAFGIFLILMGFYYLKKVIKPN